MSQALVAAFAPLFERLAVAYNLERRSYPAILADRLERRYISLGVEMTFVAGACTSHDLAMFVTDSEELLVFAQSASYSRLLRAGLVHAIRQLMWVIRGVSERAAELAVASLTAEQMDDMGTRSYLLRTGATPCLRPVYHFEDYIIRERTLLLPSPTEE